MSGLISKLVFGVNPDNSLHGWIHGGILFLSGCIFYAILAKPTLQERVP
jgi:hypothetical protein